jgi:hypothetical protein
MGLLSKNRGCGVIGIEAGGELPQELKVGRQTRR